MKLSTKIRRILKPILFCLVLLILVLIVQSKAFKISDVRSYQTFKGFYSEPKNSLDVVYIGQSNVYPFWSAPLSYEDYGFTSYPLAIGAMPARSVKYMVEEGLKTQPDALYLINLNTFTDINFDVSHLHNVTDYMSLSGTKIRLINDLYQYLGDEDTSKLEFYMPIIRFHPGWNELTESSFDYKYNGLKGGSIYSNFLETIMDVSASYRPTDARVILSDDQGEVLRDLAEYLTANKVKVLFVTVPQAIQDESVVGQLNSAKDYLESNGFDVLDMESSVDTMGLDLKTDFYNEQHLNLHGSIKFTDYVSKYLVDKYGFTGRRGEDAPSDWDNAVTEYHQLINGYALDFEYDSEIRNYEIEAPKLTALVATGQSFYLGWEYDSEDKSRDVDGFTVYRKYIGNEADGTEESQPKWERLADVDSSVMFYEDKDLELFGMYVYTVAPYETENGVKRYGKFSYTEIQGTTRIDPPEITGFEHTDEGNVISWNPVEGADGYAIVRRIDGQTFVNIGEVPADVFTYTDKFYQEGLGYTYSVSGFKEFGGDIDDRKYGYYSQNGPRYGAPDSVGSSESVGD